jgi:hypothetical protein
MNIDHDVRNSIYRTGRAATLRARLTLGTATFLSLEEKKIQKAQFRSKPKDVLPPEVKLDFNGCTLIIDASNASKVILKLGQKG